MKKSIPFWRYIRKYKKILFLALFLAAINQIFSLLDPQITRLIIDNYALKINELSKDVFIKGVGLLLLGFILVALVSRIAKNFQDYFVNVITQKVGTDIYANAVEHTFSLPYSVFEDQRSGVVLEKMQKARLDTQIIITSMINIVFLSLVGFLFVLIYAYMVNWMIFAAFILSVPFMTIFIYTVSNKIKVAQKEIVAESTDLAGSTTETIRNVELEKSLGLELKKVKYIRLLSFTQGTIVNAVRTMLLFLMLWLLYNQQVTVGEFLTLFFYSFFLFAPLGELGTVVSQYQEAKASNEKLDEILKIKPEAKPSNPKEIGKIESIEFKDAEFSYNSNGNSSIQDINIKIDKGSTIALVGMSGSGKTTLIKILLGLYKPKKGKLLFNGVDANDLSYAELRKKIGLVSQDTQLFAGTIKDNLLFVNPNASDLECIKSLKQASALSIIDKSRTKYGLNTKIGEGGIKLSGGEKQRLAIARALLRKPEIIIFDEATSSLDSLTEKEITETIKKISQSNPNLISILVSHRLSTIKHADVIYVLEKSKIIEKGNHESLIKKNGLYSALWREQIGKNNL